MKASKDKVTEGTITKADEGIKTKINLKESKEKATEEIETEINLKELTEMQLKAQ